MLGKTSGKSPPKDKERWNDEVKSMIKRKKYIKKKWDESETNEDREAYRKAN